MLDMPSGRDIDGYVRVHPQFNAIFTSNPEEYAGVYRSQDALRDRMVTLDLDHFDLETEVAITISRSGLDRQDAEKIVLIVRSLRESGVCEFAPTCRGCIMIGKTLKLLGGTADAADDGFRQLCLDILVSESSRLGKSSQSLKVREVVSRLIDKYC